MACFYTKLMPATLVGFVASHTIFIAMNVLIIYMETIPDCSMEWPLYYQEVPSRAIIPYTVAVHRNARCRLCFIWNKSTTVVLVGNIEIQVLFCLIIWTESKKTCVTKKSCKLS